MKKFIKAKYVVFDMYGHIVGQHKKLYPAMQNIKTTGDTIYKKIKIGPK